MADQHDSGSPSLNDRERSSIERLIRVVRRLGSSGLPRTLSLIADGVIEALDFQAAVVNVRTDRGTFKVEAAVGPPGIEKLIGEESEADLWRELLDGAEPWGTLFHVGPGYDTRHIDEAGMPGWRPDHAQLEGEDAWTPDDGLFAPLRDASGTLIGVLSVDLPCSGRHPNLEQRALLEVFASEAALAIADAMREAELVDSESIFRSVFDRAPIPMAVLGDDLVMLRANDAFSLLTRLPPELVHTLTDIVDPGDAEPLLAEPLLDACRSVLTGDVASVTFEHRLSAPDRPAQWAKSRLRKVETPQGKIRLVLALEDVTDSRAALDELRHRAEHDPLTGLPNRSSAHQQIEDLLAAARPGAAVAALFCDLDGFKAVNDGLGHTAGDGLLVKVAQRLAGTLRGNDALFRIGGDEFLVLCGPIASDEVAEHVAWRLIGSLEQPFSLDGQRLSVAMSVGVAITEDGGMPPRSLIDAADRALNRAKAAGGSTVHLAERARAVS
ncbi:MAG: hypothetical protein JWM85_2915 [Acidimicrobiaceae bacterium]|nr:hypothetical protein [Acidimicrobiaceae bacterium]